jgi:TPR repeat protein
VVSDPRRAEQAFKKACDGRDADACIALGDLYARPKGIDGPLAAVRKKACELGSGAGCYKLGLLLIDGDYPHRVNADRPAAAQAWEKGCELKHGPSCTGFGDALAKGRGVASIDPVRAGEMYARACELKDEAGCKALEATKKQEP